MGEIITNLNPTDVISSTGRWMSPLISELWPIAAVGIGIVIFGVFVSWVIGQFQEAYDNISDYLDERKNKDYSYSGYDRLANKMSQLNQTVKTRKLKGWQARELWHELKNEDD